MSSIFAVSLSALSVDEAVDIAIKNNSDIKINQSKVEQAKRNIELSKSSLKPKLDLAYSYTNRFDRPKSIKEEYSTGGITASYNLFNGYKDKADIESKKFLKEAAKYVLSANKHDIKLNTKVAYINYLNRKKELRTFESSFKSFKKQFEDATNRYNQGLLARNNLLEVEVEMLDSKQNVVRAKSNLKIAKYELGNILGGVDLTNEDIIELEEEVLNISDYSQVDLENRSELKAIKARIDSSNSNVKIARAEYYPTVDFSLNYKKDGDEITLNEDEQGSATVSVSWNLYNGDKTKSNILLNKELSKELKESLVKTRLDIKLQYQKALAELEVSKENLETSKLALLQATQNYEIVNNKFLEGLSTSSDLIDANYLLTQARQKYYKAYYDEFIAIATLDRIMEK